MRAVIAAALGENHQKSGRRRENELRTSGCVGRFVIVLWAWRDISFSTACYPDSSKSSKLLESLDCGDEA
jgi:hypothetical protein